MSDFKLCDNINHTDNYGDILVLYDPKHEVKCPLCKLIEENQELKDKIKELREDIIRNTRDDDL